LQAQRAVSPADGHAIAGLLDAEAHFSIARQNRGTTWRCSLSVRLRDDDGRLVEWFQEVTGLGRTYAVPARRTSQPQVEWRVTGKLECEVLADLICKYPLRGRKRREADLW